MSIEQEIDAAAKAIGAVWDEKGDVPFPFYPRELRILAKAAIDAAARVRATEPQQAASIACGVCELCPTVHVNLIDDTGAVFATASVPVAIGPSFIRQFQDELIKVAGRPAVSGRQQ